MAKLVYAESFLRDAVEAEPASAMEAAVHAAELVADFPGIGSVNMPASVRERYGDSVRKFSVPPFLLVYRYDADLDAVFVLGLVPARAAR